MKKFQRVKKSEEFQSIIKRRRTVSNSTFVIYYIKASNDVGRIGISASKKMGGAVQRNKIKRQLRMMIDEVVDFNSLKIDAIIITKNPFKEQSYAVNKKYLETLLKTVKI